MRQSLACPLLALLFAAPLPWQSASGAPPAPRAAAATAAAATVDPEAVAALTRMGKANCVAC